MNAEQKVEHVNNITKEFKGNIADLERAVGMFFIGELFGWRVLYLVHEHRTLRKYEKLLGINVKEIFAERGEYADKSVGLKIADKFGNFWKLVKGETSREGVMRLE